MERDEEVLDIHRETMVESNPFRCVVISLVTICALSGFSQLLLAIEMILNGWMLAPGIVLVTSLFQFLVIQSLAKEMRQFATRKNQVSSDKANYE